MHLRKLKTQDAQFMLEWMHDDLSLIHILYNIDGKIYFGEITLTPNSGFDPDITEETDLYFGNKLEIPYWEQIQK